jgi:lia operon protein LiaG
MKLPSTLKPLAPIAIATLLVGACSSMNAQDGVLGQDVGTYTLTGDQVAIYNLAGTAELVGTDGPDLIVEVRRGGDDGALLRVDVDQIDGRESLRVIYPDDRIHYTAGENGGSTRLRVNEDGTFGSGGSFFGGQRVRISSSGSGTEAWADLRVLVPAGRDVAFYLAVGETRAEGVLGPLRLDTASGSIRTLDTVGRLEIDTGSGGIQVQGAEGEVDVDTGSGPIVTNDVRGPMLEVDTGSGSVRGERIEVESLEVDTGSGSVRLSEVGASRINVDTGSGSVALGLTRDIDELEVDTGSGSVELRIPEALGANVLIRTGSGGVESDIPLQVRSSRRGRLDGVIGNGDGRIHIETGSGGVGLLPI